MRSFDMLGVTLTVKELELFVVRVDVRAYFELLWDWQTSLEGVKSGRSGEEGAAFAWVSWSRGAECRRRSWRK